MSFWDEPQHGANSFNVRPPDTAYFKALSATGATWLRLTFTKWQGEGQTFLLRNADQYNGLVAPDLKVLRSVLDRAHDAGIKVVVSPLSLLGSRWQQHNDGRLDDRLWRDKSYWDQAAAFWRGLASELKGHPAIAAHNILNEPAPERVLGLEENAPLAAVKQFQEKHAGTAGDLRAFYEGVRRAIRAVDAATPVMVDAAGYYANLRNLAAWQAPLDGERVLYVFHMYEPYTATSAPKRWRKDPLPYPGFTTRYDGGEILWDRDVVQGHMGLAFEWAKAHGLPATCIVAAEFGCLRTWNDCGTYLTDVLDGLTVNGGHWAF